MHSKDEQVAWSRVIGQHRVKRILLSALRSNRLAHAYLFYGSEGVGKDAMALEFARVLQCDRGGEAACYTCDSCRKMDTLQHPDVSVVTALPVGRGGEKPEDPPLARLTESEVHQIQQQYRLKGQNPYHRIVIPRATVIKINSIREVRRESSKSTYGNRKRVVIISRAEEMNDPSANTILKTLEEPAGNTMLILTAVSREALLPTIVSRCQCVRFDPLTEDEIKDALIGREGVDGQRAALVARLANGSYLRAMELLADDLNQVRGHVLEFIRRSVAGNVAALNEQIEGLAAGKNRMEVYNFLALLLMWFRDALVLLHGGEVINLDQKESLERFVQRYPSADLGALIGETERAVFLLERNVYIKLVLIHLAFKIKKHVLTPSAASVTSVES